MHHTVAKCLQLTNLFAQHSSTTAFVAANYILELQARGDASQLRPLTPDQSEVCQESLCQELESQRQKKDMLKTGQQSCGKEATNVKGTNYDQGIRLDMKLFFLNKMSASELLEMVGKVPVNCIEST